LAQGALCAFALAEPFRHERVLGTDSAHPMGFLARNALRQSSKRFYWILLRKVWADVQADNCVDLAAQMSFYFILSVFPFLLVIASVIGWLPSTNVWHNFAQWISHYLPPYSRAAFFHTILGLTHGYSSFFSLGLIGMIWAASSGFTTLMASLNIAYEVRESREFWKRRMIAVVATILAAVFLFGSFGLLTAGHWVVGILSADLKWVQRFRIWFEAGRWLTTVALLIIGLDLTNYFLPDRKHRWHWFTPGRIFATVMFVGTSLGFNLYVGKFANYSRVYGALAGAIILLLWIYAFSLILLVGAEIDNSFERLKGERRSA
jgi:membrane protein